MDVKICGMTSFEDIEIVNKYLPEYVGFILFFPKSKRNIELIKAQQLANACDKKIKKVAVLVSPEPEQCRQVCELKSNEKSVFDIIQIHGELSEASYEAATLPIWKAFNDKNIELYDDIRRLSKVVGYVFDAATYGGGKTFDWSILNHLTRDKKHWMLAGGLNEHNVKVAMESVEIDGVDVSSSVEKEEGTGKDEQKIKDFIRMVRHGK